MPRHNAILALAALLAGCASAPPYSPPAIQVPPAFKQAGPWVEAGDELPAKRDWWRLFGDPQLDELIGRIDAGSPTLAAAVARYDRAAAETRAARAELAPQIGAGADISRERLSANRAPGGGTGALFTDAGIGGSLSYEIDLFGRLRGQLGEARRLAEASEADVAAVRLGLQTRLANAYFEVRALEARGALLRETVDAYGKAYDLTGRRHRGGIASGIDVSRAATLLAAAKAELESVSAARARGEHAIALLVGDPPAAFALSAEAGLAEAPGFAVGIPSTMLQLRPDIIAAERRVAAANEGIGVARAALFPRLTLGASGGFESAAGDILSASNGFWALGPLSAVGSIFDGGARRARVGAARAQFDEAAANYREIVLRAFGEVEDDLASLRHLRSQRVHLETASQAAERTASLALTRYRDGAADYLEVVTAQTAALDAQRSLLSLRSEQLTRTVDLARAIGGGALAQQEGDRADD